MWQKLFGTAKISSSESKNLGGAEQFQVAKELLEPGSWKPPGFDISQLRLILCQDGGDKSKAPLYDSALEPCNAASSLNPTEPSKPPLRRANLGAVGDMMFGTVPMSFKGTTTKIHPINGPTPQLLLTVVFSVSLVEIKPPTCQQSELDETEIQGRAIPGAGSSVCNQDIVSSFSHGSAQLQYDEDGVLVEEGRSPTSSSVTASLASSLSSFHNVHLDRRLKKAGLTSLEHGHFRPSTLPGRGSYEDLESLKLKSPTRMYALGFLVTLGEADRHLRDFIYTHYSLLEARLHKLYWVARSVIVRSLAASQTLPSLPTPKSCGISPHTLVSTLGLLTPYQLQSEPKLVQAISQFQTGLADLYLTPRIQEPLWLNMLSFPSRRMQYSVSFLSELAPIVSQFDTKSTQFFISAILTAILGHHLSWVPVVPADFYKPEATKTPLSYNPLWAQLSDLYGNIGGLSRLSRTVLVGTDGALVRRLLYIMTYFIRCNDVVLSSQKCRFEEIADKIRNNAENELNQTQKDSNINESSSAGTSIPISGEFFESLKEIPLFVPDETTVFPLSNDTKADASSKLISASEDVNFLYTKSYGRSLMTSYHDKYLPSFVLQGVPRFDFIESLEEDLLDTVRFSGDDPVLGAACVVADCNTWQCNIIGYDTTKSSASQPISYSPAYDNNRLKSNSESSFHSQISVVRIKPSQHISDTLQETCRLYEFGMPADACLQYLEDRLRQLHYKSLLLSSFLRDQASRCPKEGVLGTWDVKALSQIVSSHESDVPLIVAITSTYDPIARDFMLPNMR